MTNTLRLGIAAMLSVTLIASMVALLSPGGASGLFYEEHGHCALVIGGVKSYRYCGPEVEPVDNLVWFKNSRDHAPFIPSGEQQYPLFDQQVYIERHTLETVAPRHTPGPDSYEALEGQPFSQERWVSRRHLFDDPYASTPWEKE